MGRGFAQRTLERRGLKWDTTTTTAATISKNVTHGSRNSCSVVIESKWEQGLIELEEAFREVVAAWLLALARRRGGLPDYEVVLDTNPGRLDVEAFHQIWTETLTCILKNVRSRTFRSEGSLCAYVLKIASCRTSDLFRQSQKSPRITGAFDESNGSEPSVEGRQDTSEIQEEFNVFYDKLGSEFCDKLGLKVRRLLEIGVEIRARDGT